jgi:hypothetical protein
LKASLGEEGAKQAAWLINQKALRPYIERGAPFEYTLRGIAVEKVKAEREAIEAIWQGKSENEVLDILKKADSKLKTLPARVRELQELYSAGYTWTLDTVHNRIILIKP